MVRRANQTIDRVSTFSYPALLITQNNHKFYFSTIPVDDLFSCCYVASRKEDPEKGFQRSLSEPRADDIASYLASGSGSIPTNIVLSAQDISNFSYNSKSKTISYARVPLAFLVLDGQHRLWGYQKCITRHRVPVAIYVGLTRSEETKLFIDINTNQRGVPAALLLDIKQLASIESSTESVLRDIFDRLKTDPSSPLVGKLSSAKSAPNKISRVTFNRAISQIIDNGVLSGANDETQYKLLLNFLNAFDAELIEKNYLTRSAYFEAIMELFDEIIREAISTKSNAKQESIQHIIRPLAKINITESIGSTLTKKGIVNAMQTTLRRSMQISGEML